MKNKIRQKTSYGKPRDQEPGKPTHAIACHTVLYTYDAGSSRLVVSNAKRGLCRPTHFAEYIATTRRLVTNLLSAEPPILQGHFHI